MRRRHLAYLVSGACVLVSILSLLIHGGPRYGVDFTGGTLIEARIDPPLAIEAVRAAVDRAGHKGAEIQRLDQPGQVLIRLGVSSQKDPAAGVGEALRAAAPRATVEILRVEQVGPRVGTELRNAAIKAVFLALGLILIYVAIRYDWRYSFGAVIALFHDIFITLGAVSITNREMTLNVLAALLTIAGFSINDTIVVFDRIRERAKSLRREKPETVMNIAINETLSRTIITSFTVFLTVVALMVFGGEVLRDFSFAMMIGVVFGTYSSVYVASALALETQLWLERSAAASKK
jgi:preprotein translocase subunit SecF